MSKWHVSEQSIYDENSQQVIEATEWYMREQLENICSEHNQKYDVQLHSMNIQNGKIDMSLSGEPAKTFMASLIQFFKQNGGKNFLCQTVEFDNGTEKYSVTIQNCNGELTPAEELEHQKRTIEIYRKYWFELCNSILAELDKDGWCRLVVTREEALEMIQLFENLKDS